MENTPLFFQTLFQVLGCHSDWLDLRHRKTMAWMVNGLILSGKIGLGIWAYYIHSQAEYVASTIRRFRRFLDKDRIKVHALLVQAFQGWDRKTVYVALDTSMLWNTYCIIRLSLIYRDRAVPLVWEVLEHSSASVAYQTYQKLLDIDLSLTTFTPACQVSDAFSLV